MVMKRYNTMRSQSAYFVYLLSSLSGTLYVGLTDNLWKRVQEHKAGTFDGFTRKYKINRLMYFETYNNSTIAADRERQVKKWRREKKVALFAKSNPQWRDLTPEIAQIIGFPRPLAPARAKSGALWGTGKRGLGISEKP
ncbi:MAG TPA: GIY-YIG nuclease family protein [Candidatus Angelobacter sp.]|nr:GIY-YIG nuclease family protein [Candidatus Angelobacter sp.]